MPKCFLLLPWEVRSAEIQMVECLGVLCRKMSLLWPLKSFCCNIWCLWGNVLDVVMAMAEGCGGDPRLQHLWCMDRG